MIGITPRARRALKKLLSSELDHPLAALRLVTTDAGDYGLSIDIESKGDQVIEYGGSKVLLVGEKLSNELDGLTFDIEDTPSGSNLVIYKERES